jgi:hypothetical protein
VCENLIEERRRRKMEEGVGVGVTSRKTKVVCRTRNLITFH